jgi:hypothetical protein
MVTISSTNQHMEPLDRSFCHLQFKIGPSKSDLLNHGRRPLSILHCTFHSVPEINEEYSKNDENIGRGAKGAAICANR